MQEEKGYKRLIAWQKANELAHLIYKITAVFPKSELFGLTSQIRRAALSIAANIVEGYARANKNEFRHFLSISLGSLAELDYFIEFSYEEKLISIEDYNKSINLLHDCGRLIWKLYQSQGRDAKQVTSNKQ